MVSLAELAYQRQDRIVRVGDRAATIAVRAWSSRMRPDDLDQSWLGLEPDLTNTVTAGQAVVVAGSTRYTAQAAADRADDGIPVETVGFSGVDGSGRSIPGLLYGAVTTTKTLIGQGAGIQAAMRGGAAYLSAMVATATADTARSGDLTAAVGRKYTHYIRVVQPGACSRCAILAGISSYKQAFLRHPRCRCTSMPVEQVDASPARLFATPDDYFRTLSSEEQDRVFTRAGAEAIRAGADPVTVVTARSQATGIAYSRRGTNPGTLPNSGRRLQRTVIGMRDGQPVYGYTTGEGVTRRGSIAKNAVRAGIAPTRRIRLMPETVVALTDDVELRRVLLRDAGYLRYPTDLRERNAVVRADRAAADEFYKSRGITLG